jgi:hypothetical protein
VRTPTNLHQTPKVQPEYKTEYKNAYMTLENLVESFNENETSFKINNLSLFSWEQTLIIYYNCDYEDRHLAKNAGFRWDNLSKNWYTTDISIAKNAGINIQKLQEIAEAFEIFKQVSDKFYPKAKK